MPDVIVSRRFIIDNKQIPYEAGYDLSVPNNNIKKIVFVIHGTNRNADDYYIYARDGANRTGEQNVSIIAPQFLRDDDLTTFSLSNNDYHCWTNDGWKSGNTTTLTTGPSSYAVLDAIILQALSNFPNATHVTVTGHSAGGQFVNRYAAGGKAEDQTLGKLFKYDFMNPSSYMYFTKERPVSRSTSEFYTPTVDEGIYNNYKYGLRNLNSYMTSVGLTKISQNYATRDINWVLGLADIERDSDLDTAEEAEYQGYNRLERGVAYWNHIQKNFTNNRFTLVYVPDVGHSAGDMYRSQNGSAEIFNHQAPTVIVPPLPDDEDYIAESFLRYRKPWR